jgi:hypothetical protein
MKEEQKTAEELIKERKKFFQEKRKSDGLGDTIANITKAIGIKPCGGCKKRQAKLNKLFPYNK